MFKQKKLSLGARFGLSVASFFLGLLLFVSILATVLIANVQVITSQDGLSGILRIIMSTPVAASNDDSLYVAPSTYRTYQLSFREETPAGDTNADADADAAGDVAADLTEQVIGMFYEAMGDMFGEDMTFTQEEFTQMVNDSTVKDYIADKTAALIVDYLNDEVTTTFEVAEVVDLIHENSALIESITGAPIPDDIAERIGKAFDENEIIAKVEAEGLAGFMAMMEDPENPDGSSGNSMLELLKAVKDYYATVSAIASTQNLLIGIAVCLVLMACIILINCRQLGKGLRRVGYPLIFAGCVYFALNAVLGFASDFLGELFAEDPSMAALATTIPELFRYILSQTAVVNIVIFSVGCALFVAGIVLPIVLRVKSLAPVRVAVTAEAEELAAAIVDETPVEITEDAVAETVEEAPVEEESAPVAE